MNEEIINGIDVSECDAYKDKHCMDKTSIMFCDLNTCSNFPNCYYKQLKRLQSENERLKEIIETQNPWHNCKNCNKNYKQPLEEIREICNNTCQYNKDCIHSCYECKSIDEPVAINRILSKINEVLK